MRKYQFFMDTVLKAFPKLGGLRHYRKVISKLRITLFTAALLTSSIISYAQTTVSSGNWSDATVWSTGAVPVANNNVNATKPLILDQNITIGTGDWVFSQNVTDVAGGSAASLSAQGSGCSLEITAGTTTFEGNATFQNCTLTIRNGATLILGATLLNNNNIINIEAGGVLIVNGTFNNSNSAGNITLNGTIYVNGDYITNNGNIDIGGSGNIFTTGEIDTQGSSDVFGNTAECTTGPCSGRNLCSYSNVISNSNQTLCSGGTPANMNANAVASSPTYIWESSTTSDISGFNLAAGTNNTEDYIPASLSQTTWFRRKVIQGGCTGISSPVRVTIVPSAGGWIGTTTDWNTASNWCDNTVPVSTTDVTISTGVTNMPTMTAASVCHNLTIGSGASVTINGSNTFSLFGDLVNNGSFIPNSSTVSLVGTSQQTVSGSSINFNNLTINNTAATSPQVTMSGFYNVLTTLTMTAGSINLSGYNLTLGNNTGSTGTLTYTAGNIIDGEFTRWMGISTIADGSNTGLFPMGTALYNRPLYISYPATAPNPAGKIKVSHTGASTVTGVSVIDGASTIQLRHNSFWTISTSGGLGGGIYNLRAGGTGFGVIQEVADLRLMKASSVVGTSATNGNTPSDPRVNRTGISFANLATSFYIGSVDPANTTLPIELLSFEGKSVQAGVQLNWVTASEKNFNYFGVEHSADGIHFTEFAQEDGRGDSRITTDYYHVHGNPVFGKNYYRLRSVDLDGSYVYSKLVVVVYQESKRLTAYPNPTASTHIQYQANFEIMDTDRISVVSQVGKQVAQGIPDTRDQVIHFSSELNPGIYLLYYSGSEFKTVIRVVVK
jgi:hypothetical protein